MRLYQTETRNFNFITIVEEHQDFIKLFKQKWKKHCKDYVIPFNKEYFDVLLEESHWLDIEKNICYRDNSKI